MARTTVDVHSLLDADNLAKEISNRWTLWNNNRAEWTEEKEELRNYVFATDTRSTSNRKLPWANSTTTPKLTQIYDNLKANYAAALFPNTHWMKWEASDVESANKDKAATVQAYLENKHRQSGFEQEMDKLVDDFILYGNCFATVSYESEYNEVDEELIAGYIGPRVSRISPHDIAFDPTAATFEDTPKITRTIVSMGRVATDPLFETVKDRMIANRQKVSSSDYTSKSKGYIADGFASIEQYYQSEYVELLTFYGTIYDLESGAVKANKKIVVVDRAYVVIEEDIASWLGSAPIFHAGWRKRPDNLYAMGPLDNLVGMQYRIDHLENLKADVFDQIAYPVKKIRGSIDDISDDLGEHIYLGDEGDVTYLVPDATALNADFQIQTLENKMEEMAGAPRQAMGIRTPGEKTAFEVQTLQNAASRIFQHKAAQFERDFVEPLLNAELEAARRNMAQSEMIAVSDDVLSATLFQTITKEDITAKGKIVPIGARHFAERAQRVQNVNQLIQIKASDPTVGVHLSGKSIAKLLAEELGEKALYKENVGVDEQLETQEVAQDAQVDAEERQLVAAEEGL